MYLDTSNDAPFLNEVNEGSSIIRFLVQGLVKQDHTRNVFGNRLKLEKNYSA